MALPMIRLAVSHTPIGRTPGFLSSGMRRHAISACRGVGSTYSVQRRRVAAARALQRDVDAPWKALQMRRQPLASIPDGPADPSVRSAAWRMESPLIFSNSTGWNGRDAVDALFTSQVQDQSICMVHIFAGGTNTRVRTPRK